MQNIHRRFVLCSNGQIYVGGFAKFCGLLRIYELYVLKAGFFRKMVLVLSTNFGEKSLSVNFYVKKKVGRQFGDNGVR